MTVTTTLDREYFECDGVNKNFPFDFKFLDSSHIFVYLIDSEGVPTGKTLNIDYSLSGVGNSGGGSVTFLVAPPYNYRVLVRRVVPQTQPTSIRNQGAFFPSIHEDVFDRLTMLSQQSISESSTALKLNLAGTSWDFKGLRGINVGSPVSENDAATKKSVEDYVGSVIATGQGPINSAANVLYTDPFGQVKTVQDFSGPGGAKMSGWKRSPLTSAISTVGQMLDAQGRSILEFADLVTNKPDPANPNTWDWTPAFTKACEGQISLFPAGEQCTVVVPPGIYKVSKFVCGRRVQMYFAGGSLAPFDRTAVEPYLVKCIGHSRIYNITVDMDYATKYDTVMWFRGRHIDVFGPEIWRAKNCFTFGDPAWANDPALGVLGDSEVNIIGGDTVWCVQHHKCYGQNTIVTFTGNHKGYIYQDSLDPSDPRYAEWMAIEPIYGENWGGLIYYTGCMLATFTGQVTMLRSHVQPVPTDNPAYKNAYGKYYLDNCHIEAGRFFECVDGAVGFKANDTSTRMFTMRGCNGFLTGNPAWMVGTGESLQSVYIDDSNNFYGQQVLERLIYAPAAPVHFGLKAFTNIKDADPFAAMYMTKSFGYPGFNPVRKTSTAQSFTPSFTTVVHTTIASADIRNYLQTAWTSMSNGRFIPTVPIGNLEIQVALSFTGGQLSDVTTFRAVVDGAQQDIISVAGVLPTTTLRVRRMKAGQSLEIQVSQSQSRTADGSTSNRIIFTGDV